MLSNLFVIGSTDLTGWEKTEQHNVNRENVFTEWEDGNHKLHRVFLRTRVSGAIVLNFKREADFSAFMALMTSARTSDGYYAVTVWCANTGTTEAINAFLEIVGEDKFDVSVPIKHHTITVTITER